MVYNAAAAAASELVERLVSYVYGVRIGKLMQLKGGVYVYIYNLCGNASRRVALTARCRVCRLGR